MFPRAVREISGEGGGQLPQKKIVQGKLVRKKKSCKSATTKKNASIGQKNLAAPKLPKKRILHKSLRNLFNPSVYRLSCTRKQNLYMSKFSLVSAIGRWKSDKQLVTFTNAVYSFVDSFKHIFLSAILPMYCFGQLIHCLKISGNKNNLRSAVRCKVKHPTP